MLKPLAIAAFLVLPLAAQAQYNQGPQPYNPQDPQNYGAPASQSYYSGQQAQPQYPQQPQYQQPQQPNPGYPDQGYGQQQGYGDPNGQYQGAPAPQGQEQIYQAPPPLPTYDQPPAPGDGYIWTPGYWAFGPAGYYWVPGAWVLAPYDGALWTPGYWGYADTGYFWNAGYWGPFVGFYGGINYGFGYFGSGFWGGRWRDHHFWYNGLYAHIGGGSRFTYSARFDEVRGGIGPSGRSFTTASAPRGEFRGGSLNGVPAGRGFAGGYNNGAGRGYSTPGYSGLGRAAIPGTSYSTMNRGSYAAPVQRSAPAQSYAGRPQSSGYNGGGRSSAPAQHYSAPGGGGSHFSGGGGHSSGGRR